MEDGPEAVDFDALHAALGDPLELDELPPAAIEGDEERVGESSGATSRIRAALVAISDWKLMRFRSGVSSN